MKKSQRIPTARNAELDFWKFFAMIIIVIHHSYNLFEKKRLFFPHGSIYVEFFFIISGFLMALSASKKPRCDVEKLGTETVGVILGKLKRLLPYYIFGWITMLISDIAYFGADKVFTADHLLRVPFSLTLLHVSGIPMQDVVGTDWYLSAMFMAMAVLYPILRRWNDIFIKIAAPLIAIAAYAFMINRDGYVVGFMEWYGVFCKGFFRGIAGISLGCSAFAVSRWLRRQFMYKGVPLLLSFVSTGCMLCTAALMYFEIRGVYQGTVVLLFYIAVVIIASRTASINAVFQNKFCVKLGKLSMAVYLTHISLTRWINLAVENSETLLNFRKSEPGPPVLTAVFVVLSLVFGMVCIAVTEPIEKKLKELLKNQKQKQLTSE